VSGSAKCSRFAELASLSRFSCPAELSRSGSIAFLGENMPHDTTSPGVEPETDTIFTLSEEIKVEIELYRWYKIQEIIEGCDINAETGEEIRSSIENTYIFTPDKLYRYCSGTADLVDVILRTEVSLWDDEVEEWVLQDVDDQHDLFGWDSFFTSPRSELTMTTRAGFEHVEFLGYFDDNDKNEEGESPEELACS
jgi:hypothetical protein